MHPESLTPNTGDTGMPSCSSYRSVNGPENRSPLVKRPYLVQRGEIRRPLKDESCRFSDAVNLDYMGSAEFEFGALPKSLRALQARVDSLKKTVLVSVMSGDVPLKVLHGLSDAAFKEYEGHLLAIRADKHRLKESSHFAHDYSSQYAKTDFWWDIDNHVMWSFDKEFMNRLPSYLASSWKYMDLAKASGA